MKNLRDINHQNFLNKDNKVFCKRLNKILSLDNLKCEDCEYFYGSLQGQGVECFWEDFNETPAPIVSVFNPQKEMLRVSKLIDKNIIKKG